MTARPKEALLEVVRIHDDHEFRLVESVDPLGAHIMGTRIPKEGLNVSSGAWVQESYKTASGYPSYRLHKVKLEPVGETWIAELVEVIPATHLRDDPRVTIKEWIRELSKVVPVDSTATKRDMEAKGQQTLGFPLQPSPSRKSRSRSDVANNTAGRSMLAHLDQLWDGLKRTSSKMTFDGKSVEGTAVGGLAVVPSRKGRAVLHAKSGAYLVRDVDLRAAQRVLAFMVSFSEVDWTQKKPAIAGPGLLKEQARRIVQGDDNYFQGFLGRPARAPRGCVSWTTTTRIPGEWQRQGQTIFLQGETRAKIQRDGKQWQAFWEGKPVASGRLKEVKERLLIQALRSRWPKRPWSANVVKLVWDESEDGFSTRLPCGAVLSVRKGDDGWIGLQDGRQRAAAKGRAGAQAGIVRQFFSLRPGRTT